MTNEAIWERNIFESKVGRKYRCGGFQGKIYGDLSGGLFQKCATVTEDSGFGESHTNLTAGISKVKLKSRLVGKNVY